MNKEVFKRKWQPIQIFNVIYIICRPDLVYSIQRERGGEGKRGRKRLKNRERLKNR